jgi:glycosyltransferase involved in cell wall biosynthesis
MKLLSAKLGVANRFVFLGKRDDVPEIMNACDLIVVPSRAEPFGKVVIEAMACGKCVIASAVGGIPEIIQDGWNGRLVPPGNLEALQSAMLEVLRDNNMRTFLSRNGCRTAKEKFSINTLVEKTQDLYTSLLNKSKVGDRYERRGGPGQRHV